MLTLYHYGDILKSSKGNKPINKREVKNMKASRHGVVEEVATMIRTGASEKAVGEYVDNLLKKEEITTRIYDLLIGMIIDNY